MRNFKILVSLCLIVAILCGLSCPIFAIVNDEGILVTSIIEPISNYDAQIKECINQMEGGVGEDTDVILGLNSLVNYYTNMMNSDSSTNSNQISNLIDGTNELIEAYNEYIEYVEYVEYVDTNTHTINESIDAETIMLGGAMAVAAFVFWKFEMDLALELLLHSFVNEELDSIYYPIHKDDLMDSDIFEEICSNNILESDDYCFPKEGTTNDIDLYLAIHNFKYTKSVSGRALVIHDRYDFAEQKTFDSIFNHALQVAYLAQEANIVTPFNPVFIFDFEETAVNAVENIELDSSTHYYENVATLGKSEHKDYNITFEDSGIKTIQTFGSLDAYLSIYDNEGNLLISNDDSGYSLNSLIQYNFKKDVEYTVRVKFFSSTQSGTVKLGIISGSGEVQAEVNSITQYENIYSMTPNGNTITISATNNETNMYRYIPTEMSEYTFNTPINCNSYIALIDPRQSYYISSSAKDSNNVYNNNSQINVELGENIPFLIICYVDSTPHTHSYTEYAKYSSTHHIEACECGATGTQKSPHVIKSSDTGLSIAFCMLCGQKVNLDNTIVMVPGLNSAITQVTLNGSYILPNGIIVLVDEDIEAYFGGTLVFYDKDELPVVQ